VARFDIVCVTDPGRVRSGNEDAVLGEPDLGLAVLADGMGGYAAGEVASKLAVDEVHSELSSALPHLLVKPVEEISAGLVEDMRFAASRANDSILNLAKRESDYEGMGSTLVIAVLLGDRICVGHLGDSRAYRWRAGRLEQLTRDHCWVDEQVAAGSLAVDALINERYKNIVTRALGIEEEVDLEVHEHDALKDDIFLLCSDGLTDMVTDLQIEAVLAEADTLEQRARKLVDMANGNGGKDNISVVLMREATEVPAGGWAKRLVRRLAGGGAA
jgi:PPM family protein phosphatase